MERKNLIKISIIAGSLLVAAIIVFLVTNVSMRSTGSGDGDEDNSSQTNFFGTISFTGNLELDLKAVIKDDPQVAWVIDKLKEKYKGKLTNKRSQLRLVGGLIRYLKKNHPNDWKERIKIIILAEFPDHSVELLDKLDKLEEYHAFLDENKSDLKSLGYEQRKQAIQEIRRELFGDEYDEIWRSEIAKEKVSKMLNELNWKKDLSLSQKVMEFKNFTNDIYSESSDRSLGKTEDDISVRNYDLANKFLGMPSVQSELSDMTPNERASFLRKFRESMGLNQEMVNKLAEIDTLRDELWKNGAQYNDERKQILSSYTGEERARRIDEARKKYFGKNANIIKFEEESANIYRFEYPRRYGRD